MPDENSNKFPDLRTWKFELLVLAFGFILILLGVEPAATKITRAGAAELRFWIKQSAMASFDILGCYLIETKAPFGADLL